MAAAKALRFDNRGMYATISRSLARVSLDVPNSGCATTVAIVTGAGNGLGRAYAEYLGRLGAKVLVNDTSRLAAEKVAATIGGGNKALANYDSVENGEKIVHDAVSKCRSRQRSFESFCSILMGQIWWTACAGGRVDILVNNAGVIRDSSFAKMTKEQWDTVYNVHLEGTMK